MPVDQDIRTYTSFYLHCKHFQFSSVQLLSHVRLFETPWSAAHQASLSISNSWSLLKLMSTKSMMPSNHLILCHPLLLLPSIFSISLHDTYLPLEPRFWEAFFK